MANLSVHQTGVSLRLTPAGDFTVSMKNTHDIVYRTLHTIYDRHRQRYEENSDSKQMCCMWSTYDPPDIIEGTEPFCDIETAFGICIDEDDALQLYDMDLDVAARKIMEMWIREC